MYHSLALLFLTVVFIEKGFSKLAPDYIHPCKIDDSKCMTQSTIDALPDFTKGLPELGVPPLDPFLIGKTSIPLPGLKVTFSHGNVTGLRKTIVDNVKSNYKEQTFTMEFHGNVILRGRYTAVGRILTFPIDGDGQVKIKLSNYKIKITINTETVMDKNGIQHFSAKNYKYTFDYGDKMTINMTNLFKTNPELSNTLNRVINENWRILADEFGRPIMDHMIELTVRTIEKFFLAVPYEELINIP